MFNYWLGGTDWEPADKARADRIGKIIPASRMAVNNRLFAARAVAWAAQSVSQFLDLGCGLPPDGNAHDWARTVRPGARGAYADRDPEVADTLGAVLYGVPGVAVARADIRDPAAVFGDPGVKEVIDLERPVCLLLALVLHFQPPDEARELMAQYVSMIAPGSFVAVSTLRVDDPQLQERLEGAYPARLRNFTRAQFRALFGGLAIEPPGIVPAVSLRPGWAEVPLTPPGAAYVLAGIGRKPAGGTR